MGRSGKIRLAMGDLRLGDILLKRSLTCTINRVTMVANVLLARKWYGSQVRTVHSTIYAGDGQVFESTESDTEALRRVPVVTGIDWAVYRFASDDVARLATYVAEDQVVRYHADPPYGAYTLRGALESIARPSRFTDRRMLELARRWSGRFTAQEAAADAHRQFFCSGFVVDCFDLAGYVSEPRVVPLRTYGAHTTPRELHHVLAGDGNWRMVGTLHL